MALPVLDTLAMACLVLLVAHSLRAWRWALLFPPGYLRDRLDLLLGLSVGYALNAVVPMRLGEAVRAAYVGSRQGVRLPFVLATVAVERMLDALTLAVALAALHAATGAPLLGAAAVLAGLALGTACAAAAVGRSARVRRVIWAMASVFNDRLRLGAADFAWSLFELASGRVALGIPFLLVSAAMWSAYATSYWLFALACGFHPSDLLGLLYGNPLQSLGGQITASGAQDAALAVAAFLLAPLVATLCYGAVLRRWRPVVAISRFGRGIPTTAASARDRYKLDGEYGAFLAATFGAGDATVTRFGLAAMGDGVVHRFFGGGSGAVTALVEVGGSLRVRKFAAGAAGEKLRVQADWLERHAGGSLPLVEVAGSRDLPRAFVYDMPLVVPSTDLYDVIHTAPLDVGKGLLLDVFGRVDRFHRSGPVGVAPKEDVEAYLGSKVTANARTVLSFARGVLSSDAYSINGVTYDLSEWDALLDTRWLAEQVRDRRVGPVHGDLTIENLIVAPGVPTGWYAIDPNPDNTFDSPLIDWAKLMQSLHLGYEGLNRAPHCSASGPDLTVAFTRSLAYGELHAELERLAEARLGPDGLREVYFHELVNYLRLTPYKIRQDATKGLCFFACTSVLLRRYRERWPGGWAGASVHPAPALRSKCSATASGGTRPLQPTLPS